LACRAWQAARSRRYQEADGAEAGPYLDHAHVDSSALVSVGGGRPATAVTVTLNATCRAASAGACSSCVMRRPDSGQTS
jgi:hypothetical protein